MNASKPSIPYADLHTHSRASDGSLSPAGLVEAAAALGLRCIALTDHDTVAGVDEAAEAGGRARVRVIAGCEMTCYLGKGEVHVLAYFAGSVPAAFIGLLEDLARERFDRTRKIVEQLNRAGVPLPWDRVAEVCGGSKAPGRAHVARALAACGLIPSVAQAWNRFLNEGRPGYVPKRQLTPIEVLGAIRSAGGAAALAHPGITSHDETIGAMAGAGMAGIEAHYPGHSRVNEEYYVRLAAKYGLAVIGGSDYHGADIHAGARLGSRGCCEAAVEGLLARAGR